ncbi:DUF6790 family protein [Amaricoccus sp.]|uniref:DUF6790 family protein n=1 Tax=Amaricoccus sp. TaxID=1872485 RepID=UPI001B5E6EB5|nr:DUF6790 family protein [Amaricoccus sp.]MBP7241285.1 hypothetical protein [Amaricoccus sp.]
MAGAIAFALGNFTLTFLVLGLVAAAVSHWRRRIPGGAREEVFAWFLFFSIGVSFFYNFVFHVFFGDLAASYIGWQNSPFQAEVGYASLGFAVVGFLAFRGGDEVRLAAVVGPGLFLWGAALGHVLDMIRSHNFAPGNAGVIFWTDILLPVVGLGLWLASRGRGPARRAEAPMRGGDRVARLSRR